MTPVKDRAHMVVTLLKKKAFSSTEDLEARLRSEIYQALREYNDLILHLLARHASQDARPASSVPLLIQDIKDLFTRLTDGY